MKRNNYLNVFIFILGIFPIVSLAIITILFFYSYLQLGKVPIYSDKIQLESVFIFQFIIVLGMALFLLSVFCLIGFVFFILAIVIWKFILQKEININRKTLSFSLLSYLLLVIFLVIPFNHII